MGNTRITFAEAHPELVPQWHPTKNGSLTPFGITKSADRKVWWICSKGHEWEDSVSHRNVGRGCPICSGKRILVGYNDFAHAHPELVPQWHPTKNGSLTPFGITKSSNKKVWWICSKGHEWLAPVSRRADGHGCPICSNRRVVTGYNDFAHEHPELMPSWDTERNVGVNPSKIASMSDKVVWWKCELGHSYRTAVKHRSLGTTCPKCATKGKAQRFIQAHALEFVERFRKVNRNFDSIELLGEYTGIREKIQCRCKVCGHEWGTTPTNLLDGCGCPCCACTQTSFQEQFIYMALVHKLGESNVKSRTKDVIGMELDIFVPLWKFAIELGGWNWHRDKLERDKEKSRLCGDVGIELLTIYDSCPSPVPKSVLKHCLVYRKDLGAEKSHRSLKALVRRIFKEHDCPHSFTEDEWDLITLKAFKASRRSEEGYRKSRRSMPVQNPRRLTHEEFLERLEQHGYDLSKVTFLTRCEGREKRIKCRCNVCGYVWNPLASALLKGHGCKICGCRRDAQVRHAKLSHLVISDDKPVLP